MSATELVVGSLQPSSSYMASSLVLPFKPLHPNYEFGRSSGKLQLPSLQASMARNEDRSATLHETHKEATTRSGSNVSSLLRAVQEGGSSAVMQQVSSIKQFFMPEVSLAIFTEIKKRMALSFKDDDDEESTIQDDLNGGLLEKTHEEEVTLMGPRCAWPKLKLMSIEEELQEEAVQGPRCAWPRPVQVQSCGNPVQKWKQEERLSFATGEGETGGAKCAWPRVTSRKGYQGSTKGMGSCMSPTEGLQNGYACKSSQEGSAPSNGVQKGKEELPFMAGKGVTVGPRCAWPRNTPRRMLATGVGLSLVNYLLIGQGAPALAILLEPPLSIITCGEDVSLSSSHKRSLLP